MLNPDATLAEVGETELLRHLKRRIPGGPGVLVGVGDDAAVVETSGTTLVTTDSLVEGTHFRAEWTPARLLGRKALSVNLSDVAAMAGVPSHAVVSLCLPPSTRFGFVDELYDGLLERAAETGVNVVGGNLASIEGPLVVSLTLLGKAGRVIGRRGGRPGDALVVTGTLGAAAAGLKLLAQGARLDGDGELRSTGLWTETSAAVLKHCLQAHLDPKPPLSFARALGEHDLVRAAIDLSDGFSGDLLHLCEGSGVSATVDAFSIPVNAHAASLERARGGDALALGLHGGEDYELLLALPAENVAAVRDLAVIWDLRLTVVGELAAGDPAVFLRAGSDLAPLHAHSHEHFRAMPAAATSA